MTSIVTAVAPASPQEALAHFESALRFETDCWDTHEAMREGRPDFVLFDVRNAELFARAHIPGACHMPHGKIIASKMREYPPDTVFVVYCAGPHCNGAHRAAIRLARLGRPVKIMIGGMTGWIDEGFDLASGPA